MTMKVMYTQARNLRELNKRYKYYTKYEFLGWSDKSAIRYGEAILQGCFRIYRKKTAFFPGEYEETGEPMVIFFHDEYGREDFS